MAIYVKDVAKHIWMSAWRIA